MSVTIVDIDYAETSTDVVHIVRLSNGRRLHIWSGQPCYGVYDSAEGECVVGAKLVGERDDETWDGEPYTIYTFAKAE